MSRMTDLQISGSPKTEPSRPTTVIRKRGYFIRGPVPLDWLTRAGALPGKTLHVGIVLWFLRGINKGADTVHLRSQWLRAFGFNRTTAYRALTTLEQAGLVRVERHRGRHPIVTIVLISDPEAGEMTGGIE